MIQWYFMLDVQIAHTEESRGKIFEVYRKWGVPESFLHGNRMPSAEFLRLLMAIQTRIPDMNARAMPSSPDPDDPALMAFPHNAKAGWNSCERTLRELGVHGVMSRLPLFWQIEPSLFAACQKAGAFILINDVGNMPLGAAALRDAEIDAIVTDSQDARTFSAYLADNAVPLGRVWIIVHSPHNSEWEFPNALKDSSVRVAQEVHAFPGVTVLEQCPVLQNKRESHFHVSDGYASEHAGNVLALSGCEDSPLPLFRYELPLPMRIQEVCACGKAVFAVTQ